MTSGRSTWAARRAAGFAARYRCRRGAAWRGPAPRLRRPHAGPPPGGGLVGGVLGQPQLLARPPAVLDRRRRQRRDRGDEDAVRRRGLERGRPPSRPRRVRERGVDERAARHPMEPAGRPPRPPSPPRPSSGAIDAVWRRSSYSSVTAGAEEEPVGSEPEQVVRDDEPADAGAAIRGRGGSRRAAGRGPAARRPARRGGAGLPRALGARARRLRGAGSGRRAHVPRGRGGGVARRRRSATRRPQRRASSPPSRPRSGWASACATWPPRTGSARWSSSCRWWGATRPTGTLHPGDIADLLERRLGAGDPLAAYPERLPRARPDPRPAGLPERLDRPRRAPSRRALRGHRLQEQPARRRPPTAFDYRPAALAAAMLRAHYPLQALLYLVALHRYLRWRLPGYDPDAAPRGRRLPLPAGDDRGRDADRRRRAVRGLLVAAARRPRAGAQRSARRGGGVIAAGRRPARGEHPARRAPGPAAVRRGGGARRGRRPRGARPRAARGRGRRRGAAGSRARGAGAAARARLRRSRRRPGERRPLRRLRARGRSTCPGRSRPPGPPPCGRAPSWASDGPLRLEGSLLYLDRYWGQERAVAADLLRRAGRAGRSRIPRPFATRSPACSPARPSPSRARRPPRRSCAG